MAQPSGNGTHGASERYAGVPMATSTLLPIASLVLREHAGEPFYEAKFRYGGRQVKRRIGPAWLIFDRTSGEWRPRRGRVAGRVFDERRAHVAAAEIVRASSADFRRRRAGRGGARARRGVTFRELAHGYLDWLEHVRGAKPSTIRSHRSVSPSPASPHQRGTGKTAGLIMAALGDRPAARSPRGRGRGSCCKTVAATGVSARTVNGPERSSAPRSPSG